MLFYFLRFYVCKCTRGIKIVQGRGGGNRALKFFPRYSLLCVNNHLWLSPEYARTLCTALPRANFFTEQ